MPGTAPGRVTVRRRGGPARREYGADTTTDQVLDGVDLTGRRVVITGAASGLGVESARALAAHGAAVTVLARSQEKADGAVAQLRELVPDGSFEAGVVDLADLASVRAFADGYLAEHDAIDVLMNNAGMRFTSVEAGAATQVWAATAPELADHSGAYLADCGLGVLGADPGVNGFCDYLLDDEHAAALWTLSEELTGIPFEL